MPRNYRPKPGSVRKQKHSEETMHAAIRAIISGTLTYREASEQYNIATSTLSDRVKAHKKGEKVGNIGRRPALEAEIEDAILDRAQVRKK